MGATQFQGPLYSETKIGNGQIFISAKHWSFYTGTWTDTRVAAGDYCMRKTATTNSGQAVVYLSHDLLTRIGSDEMTEGRSHDIRGFQVSSVDIIYQITTADLNTHSYDIHETAYANVTAAAVVSTAGGTLSGSLLITATTSPRVSRITLGTPYVISNNATASATRLEIAWDSTDGTTVLSYYGAVVNGSYNYA